MIDHWGRWAGTRPTTSEEAVAFGGREGGFHFDEEFFDFGVEGFLFEVVALDVHQDVEVVLEGLDGGGVGELVQFAAAVFEAVEKEFVKPGAGAFVAGANGAQGGAKFVVLGVHCAPRVCDKIRWQC